MNILVINSGSTSIKFQVIDVTDRSRLCSGHIDRIGFDGSFSFQATGKKKVNRDLKVPDHLSAIEIALKNIIDPETGALESLSEIAGVGHRIVHGGPELSKPELVTPEIEKEIEQNTALAPLHNPAGLLGISAVKAQLPDIPHVASFDTAYYSGMPKEAFIYALDYSCYADYGYRKFGFHGASHHYVNMKGAELTGIDKNDFRSVSCHMGGGVSLAASIGCVGVDTSVGYGTVCGVPMGTRSGDVDPEIILQLITENGMSAEEVKDLIYNKSGLLGVSGLSSDARDIMEASENGHKRARLALEIFSRSIRRYVCALSASLEGRMDALIFTAGIGENAALVREMICENLEVIGIRLDKTVNNNRGDQNIISAPDSAVKVLVIPTNEELMIAIETMEIINKL